MHYKEVISVNRIREYRIAKGLSQTELARLSGVARPNLNRIELGKATPMLSSAVKISETLGATLDELFPIEKGE